MADPLFSPDGKWMWSGSEWIPAPPEQGGQQLNMQDSVIGGDVVHNTTIHNDPTAVTEAVITALQQMGMLGQVVEQAPPPSPEVELPQRLSAGERVFVNWKNYGHFYAGKVAKVNPDGTYLIHFDDGDVEDHVNMGRIKPLDENSEAVQAYIEHDNEAERELIEAFQVFDTSGSGTIPAREYLRILTEIGDDPIPVEDVLNEFVDLGIELDSEIDYRALAKFMVASEQGEHSPSPKQEVVIHEAAIEGDVLTGYAYEHPKLGEGRINSSSIVSIAYDERATARVETQNTVYVVGPTGWKERPADHPFNPFSVGQKVLIEWNGQWWLGFILEINGDMYRMTYEDYSADWDEWVDASRLKSV